MALGLSCPRCGKMISIQIEYAGKKWKCTGCKKKIRIPDPEIDKQGRISCPCGNRITTWDVYLEEGVICPSCKKLHQEPQSCKSNAGE